MARNQKEQKSGMWQTVAGMIAGVLAVKLASNIVTTGWRLATREHPPQVDDDAVSIAKKATWVALIGAATGAARQAARDAIKKGRTGPT